MCGISVIINRNKSRVAQHRLTSMNDVIAHRGPDDEGTFYDDTVGIGHRRLSIIDLSSNGHQPFRIGNVVLAYNGEIYNYKELREELSLLGHRFKTKSDTEVLLVSYLEWGTDCIDRFNGMWAFVIYDMEKKYVFCSRDRFGIKPLYYSISEDEILFSSEVKQILAVKNCNLDRQILSEFLESGYINHTHETFFEDVLALPEGSNFSYYLNDNRYIIESYYDIQSITKNSLDISYEDACVQFFNLFESSVKLRLRSDVKLGLALSGGIDSTSIAAIAHNNIDNLPTFSVLYDEGKISEKKYIDTAITYYSLENHLTTPDFNELLESISSAVWHLDQPVATTSILADFLMHKTQSRNGVKVTLSGQGADEILGGYSTFLATKVKEDIENFHLIDAAYNLKEIFTNNQIVLHKALKTKKTVEVLNWDIKNRPLARNIKDVRALSIRYLNYNGLRTLVHFLDRNAMAFSIEGRVPFLDHRLVEFCLRLPSRYKLDKGVRKRILRDAMRSKLPPLITNRKNKLAYETPELRWCREHLAQLKNIIKTSDLSNHINMTYIKGLDSSIKKEEASLLIRLLSTIKWSEKFDVDFRI